LDHFAGALRHLQTGKSESARFIDYSQEVAVTLTWGDRELGRINVDTSLNAHFPVAFGAGRHPTACRVGGIGVAQSCLRCMASAIDRFLDFWPLSRNQPMLRV